MSASSRQRVPARRLRIPEVKPTLDVGDQPIHELNDVAQQVAPLLRGKPLIAHAFEHRDIKIRHRRFLGEPHMTSARFIPHAHRFAFLSAALALVAGALMTYWPRMPSIASMDHSLGRITAGFAAHLFLVLVMLWCSRQLRRLTYDLLTVLAVVSTAGFFIVRMGPFASRLG